MLEILAEIQASNEKKNTESGQQATKPTGSSDEVGINDFEMLSVIGRGAFGKVFLCSKKD
jgi:hypothetical protein